MLRRAFLAGIVDKHWTLIKELHVKAESSVEWDGQISEPFEVHQDDRQGGILSTDLCKLYINQHLNLLETSGMGHRIGNININNTACVDDIALVSENPDQAQALISMAYDYAYMEGYELQPTKSVVLNISQKQNNWENSTTFTMGPQKMPAVESATHLGIIRTT